MYFNGGLAAMRAEAPSLVAELERDPRVTLHTWPFPFRSVRPDPTGTSELPTVPVYGKIL